MAGKTEIKAKKAEIIKKFGLKTGDTGSPEVQVALLTSRINHLTHHFKIHDHDYHGKRGLLKLIGQRRRLLAYLKRKDHKRYTSLIQALELRK